MNSARSFSLALRFALREMRGGLSGFYIFLACIALGVAAIGGVNSVARSVSSGITAQGQSILGGDISFALNQREVTPAERAFIEKQGKMAASATMRSMARMPDGSDQSLVEVKAVDDAYPLYGTLKVSPQQSLADMTREGWRLWRRRFQGFFWTGWGFRLAQGFCLVLKLSSCVR